MKSRIIVCLALFCILGSILGSKIIVINYIETKNKKIKNSELETHHQAAPAKSKNLKF